MNTHDMNYLVIAGSNKCGTTALFRYLGTHPDVCPSKIKEARFFYTDSGGSEAEVRSRYQRLFPAINTQTTICVEASPTYLHGGEALATVIHQAIPDAKLLFLLRNPADRLVSYYKSQFGQQSGVVQDMTFGEFVSLSSARDQSGRSTSKQQLTAFRQEFTMARYADFLPAFLRTFGPRQVGIAFFESLRSDTGPFLQSICEYIGIDYHFYDNYAFVPQNRTRQHRSSALRKIAANVNSKFEPMFNRWPAARNQARSFYNLFNTRPASDILIAPDAYDEVVQYYRQPNAALRDFMRDNYPDQALPGWLTVD